MPLAPTQTSADQEVSDAQLDRYARLVYDRTGIRISPQKKTLLTNRLRRRLRATGVKTFDEYYEVVRKLRGDDPEWDAFLQEITTHETYLFRDEAHWDWFRNKFLAERAAAARDGAAKSLRIWSAACSTGDEPMTMACCIQASLPNAASWNVRIVATDIGVGALQHAKDAVYGERAMRLVPDDMKRRFFTQAKEGNIWQAKPLLTDLVTYKQHNLIEPLTEQPFDLVFVKNVLIYFDADSKQKVLAHIRGRLKPGAMLVVGAAEGVSDYLKNLERLEPWLYRCPPGAGGGR